MNSLIVIPILTALICHITQGSVVFRNDTGLLTYEEIAEVACGENKPAILTATSGYLESINHPSRPDEDIYCEYLIQPEDIAPGIGLYIMEFNTEPQMDYVEVYAGDEKKNEKLLSTLSGAISDGTTIYANDDASMLVTFTTDCTTAYITGFSFFYSAIGSNATQDLTSEACSATQATAPIVELDVVNGTVLIETPNYPGDYTHGSTTTYGCYWVIKAPCVDGVPYNLTLTILEFDIYVSGSYYDSLDIYSNRGQKREIAVNDLFGNIDPGTTYNIDYGAMELYFYKNNHINKKRGFRLVVGYQE